MTSTAFDEEMVETIRSKVFATGMAFAVLLALSGCGRKADLDPPSMPKDQQNNRAVKTEDANPQRPFFLDPLL